MRKGSKGTSRQTGKKQSGSTAIALIFRRVLRKSEPVIYAAICVAFYGWAKMMLPAETAMGIFWVLVLLGVPRETKLQIIEAVLEVMCKSIKG